MGKIKYIVKKYVGEIENDDGMNYHPLYKAFGENALDGPGGYITKPHQKRYANESSPISIDELQKIISKLIKKGATHVEIVYHCDHDNYIFNGVSLVKATQEDVDNFNKDKEEENKKSLERQRKELKKLLDKVDEELDGKS